MIVLLALALGALAASLAAVPLICGALAEKLYDRLTRARKRP